MIRGKTNIFLFSFLVVSLLPLALGLVYSLGYSFGLFGLMNDGFTLEHWQKLSSSKDAWSSLIYTLTLSLVSVVLLVVLAAFSAKMLLEKSSKKGVLPLLIVPLLFAPIVAGFAWYYLLSPAGILSRLAHSIGLISGLESFPRLVNDDWSIGIIVVHLFLVLPLFTLLFIAQAKAMRLKEMDALARNFGGNAYKRFFQLWVPALVHRSKLLIALYAIFFMGSYEVPLILGKSSPRTLSIFITEKLTKFQLSDVPLGHCMAVVYSFGILLLLQLFLRNVQSLRP